MAALAVLTIVYKPLPVDTHAHEIAFVRFILFKHQVQDVVDALVSWTEKEARSLKETYIWYDLITVSWVSLCCFLKFLSINKPS